MTAMIRTRCLTACGIASVVVLSQIVTLSADEPAPSRHAEESGSSTKHDEHKRATAGGGTLRLSIVDTPEREALWKRADSAGFSAKALRLPQDDPNASLRDALTKDELHQNLQKNLEKVEVLIHKEGADRGKIVAFPKDNEEYDKITYYIAEGDLYILQDELPEYTRQLKIKNKLDQDLISSGPAFGNSYGSSLPNYGTAELAAATVNGMPVRWLPGRKLSYCVLRWTFQDDAHYRVVRDNMRAATSDWAQTCNVQFEYRQLYDDVPRGTLYPTAGDRPAVTFVVAEAYRGQIGGGIARAFFPYDTIYDRILWVNRTSYYNSGADLVGVLRHELGHVLGFRHEHVRPDSPLWVDELCRESRAFELAKAPNMQLLTAFDRMSVMHYMCHLDLSGPLAENFTLRISPLDRQGAISIYGPPGGPSPTGQIMDFDPGEFASPMSNTGFLNFR